MDQELFEQARSLLTLCRKKKLTIATAESCTGGLLAGALTDVAGSSEVFERGFVTYSNDAKQVMLGVSPSTLQIYGAVSRETAQAMATGALAHAPVSLTVSVTGIAGPQGAVAGKRVGLVHFAAASRSGILIHDERNYGNVGRAQIRRASVERALALLREIAEKE
jgi:nicotinamide-nucleotide amidase